ncbi:chemotaxis protein CheA [Opitutus terrae]|uniref:Chemotaxis protein CheA n=1 Tax=Opitutus terrae (strain DSM 11246 / JCM 15787 / PB90-1) TaxID=452637 RepID=B1ZR56_OPITP|nr:chemotaxis protein CheA [Opitutus terrae]ACB73723.1 CheA signal transduction histidine kinase [Opitutus terrae PB90-1]
MPIPPESFRALDDVINRLAAESVLAQSGRDDGLVPSYSLLGDLRELCAAEPLLLEPLVAMHVALEKLLDTAHPFDDATLGKLRSLVEWLPTAVDALRIGAVPPPPPGKAAVAAATAAANSEASEADHAAAADVLLTLNLEENQELLSEFYGEAVDHLQQIEAALLVLDHEPENPEALNSIFRSFHTIKGNAGFLGLVPMHTLAHEVESLLDLARNHKLKLNAAIITEILRSRDALQALTQQVAKALEKGQLPTQIISVSHLIRAVHRLSESPAGGLQAEAPAPPAPVAEKFVEVPLPPEPSAVLPPVPVAAEPVTAHGAAPGPAPVAPFPAPAPAASATIAKVASGGTVRVNTEKLDSLMDVVGELVIVQSQLLETARHHNDVTGSPLQRNVAQLSRITKELQHTAMSLRMIPIKQSFQKMERLARDLARDFGKKVSFVTSGEDTELDRTVVEEIGDPLVHMVRNALDHGLEPPAERVAAGKPETGVLHLKAYHQGSNIVIELQDDGRGINPDKIYQKAIEKGLIAPGTTLAKEEILALVFAPGFSTAEKVTAVSGRGVGMDVVKRNIEKLRGKIEINSEVKRGSTFKVKLPLTMAIIDGLVVRVGEDRFILPSTSVQRALRPSRESVATVQGQGEVLDLRGRLVPIHRLHRRFGIPHQAENPWEGIVVIVEHSGKISALLVDEMVSKQEVVIKNLGAFMQGLPGVAGGAILGDGNIALILDPATLLQAA